MSRKAEDRVAYGHLRFLRRTLYRQVGCILQRFLWSSVRFCLTVQSAFECVAMTQDVELLRALLFQLEDRQVSPRATVLVDAVFEAETLNVDRDAIEHAFTTLFDLDYVEGPGMAVEGFWMFRKLTRKGIAFARATRDPRDWARIKSRYAIENDRLD